MNLIQKVISGLIQGLALLIFVSCEEPGRIGIDIDADNLTFSTNYTSFNLEIKVVQIDSVISGSSGRLLVGKFQDPLFGVVEAKSYTQIWLSNPMNFIDNSVYDSLILNLPYSYVSGEEIKDLNELKVFRLKESLIDFQPYFNSTELEVYDEPIGESSFIYPLELVDGGEGIDFDTIFSMRLSDVLGQEIFDKAKDENDTTFKTIPTWLDWFKGISLVAGQQYTTVTGFDQTSDGANMVLYYHIFDTDGNPVVASYPFTIKNSVHFNNISYDRTGTPLEGVSGFYKEYTASDDFFYIQSGTGLVAKIDLTPFVDYADSVGPMLINLGRLTLGKVEPYSEYLPPPATLLYYYTDSTNRWQLDENSIPKTIQTDNPRFDGAGVQFALNAAFRIDEDDEELNESYADGVSNTLQAMADGRVTSKYVLGYATPPINASSVDRVRIDPQNIKLEVYYTISNPETNN